MLEALDRLSEYAKDLVAGLQADIASKAVTPFGAVNASGRLAASLRYEVSETATGYRLVLYAASYALALEYGRRPGKFPNITSIRLWIDHKGIVPHPDAKGRAVSKNSLAFLIARKIANQGTTIYQQGRPSQLFGARLAGDIVAAELAKLLLPVIREQVASALRVAA